MLNATDSFAGPGVPAGLRVVPLTDDPQRASLIYPDEPAFLTGNRMVFHSSTGPAVCRFDEGCRIEPLFEDRWPRHIRVAPDGAAVFAVPRRREPEDRLKIERWDAGSGRMETVFEADGCLAGTNVPLTRFNLATVSSDGRRLAGSAWLGDGQHADAPFGVIVIDLTSGQARVVAEDRDFNNPHLQYCRSREPEASHDLLVQMNHGCHSDAAGKILCALGPPEEGGCDIHAVRDDGTAWRDLPWGRDGRESCIGHQVWRGEGRSAATVVLQNTDRSYGWADGTRQEVVAGWPVPARRDEHRGRKHRGARRVWLSKGVRRSRFCHLHSDRTGLRFAFDTFPRFDGQRAGMEIWIGSAPDEGVPLTFRYLLNSGVTFNAANGYHAHPILTPDTRWVLFNSNLSGRPQIYGITDFEWPSF